MQSRRQSRPPLHWLSRWNWLACSLALATLFPMGFAIKPARAEGSRSLYPAGIGGSRANLEWRADEYLPNSDNPLTRRTLLKVYAEAGELILLGSSAVGVDNGDIQVYNPGRVAGQVGQETIPAASDFSCVLDAPGQGQITTRAQELAGPLPNAGGYDSCVYVAPATGVYDVVFFGPEGANGGPPPGAAQFPTGEIDLADANNFNANQSSHVAAWDVTVREDPNGDGLPNDNTPDLTGRLFTFYLTLFAGANGRPLGSTIFAVTTDGYIYETDFAQIDPNGFILYGNRAGFLEPDGATPLFRDLVAADNDLTNPEGNVTIARPEFPLFFDEPDPNAIAAITPPDPGIPGVSRRAFIPQTPVAPVVSDFTFAGTVTGNTSLVSEGGIFSYTANVEHSYEIVISRDGVDFDPTNPLNRVLRGFQPAGNITLPRWDGNDNNGDPFPVGNYASQIEIRAGEYHFPLIDVENSEGGPQFTLINPPILNCPTLNFGCTTGFYDDRSYRTLAGTLVGGTEVNQTLPGNAPPNPDNSIPGGYDTTSPARPRAFGDNFGNFRGLDTWTQFPSESAQFAVNIIDRVADLSVAKRVDIASPQVGDNITYTITVSNAGPDLATNVELTDELPTGLTFVSATPGQGTYDSTTGVWTVGDVPVGETRALEIVATVNVLPTPDNPLINTVQVTGSDQVDPDSIPGNDNPDEDDQRSVRLPAQVADLSLTKTVNPETPTLGDNFTYTLTVNNAGPDEATGVEIEEQLPDGLTFVSATPSQGTYDSDTGLWDVGAIANGSSATLEIVVTLNTIEPVTNTAQVTDSEQIDPNSTPNNNEPEEDDQDSRTIGASVDVPLLRIVKRITAITRDGVPLSGVDFDRFVDNPDDPDDNVPGWSALPQGSPIGIFELGSETPLQSGDEVEYTIYFIADGPIAANDIRVCDPIPAGTTYISESISLTLPPAGLLNQPQTDAAGDDAGAFVGPLDVSPPFSAPPCPDPNNANGAVFSELGTIPNTSPDNVGFIRFRVRLD